MVTSTFAAGRLAMIAARETLALIGDERLPERAYDHGMWLGERLQALAGRHAVVKAVRGRGLLWGIELAPASGILTGVVPSWARDGILAQVLCLRLLDRQGILAQPCSLADNVLRIEPPLTIGRDELERGIAAIEDELAAVPGYNTAVAVAAWERLRHLWS
jgi:4-aminobutyrate aminotransferase-like enzyme